MIGRLVKKKEIVRDQHERGEGYSRFLPAYIRREEKRYDETWWTGVQFDWYDETKHPLTLHFSCYQH